MVYFEKEVTVADTVRIKERLSHYVMNILHDDGLYRHLHCYWPDDPYGANNCSFQVLTTPGSVTIYGDWMSAATLKRNDDMLLDFCNTPCIDMRYWAEKLDAPHHCKHDLLYAIDKDAFLEDVDAAVYEWAEGDEELYKPVIEQINNEFTFDEACEHPFTTLFDMTFDVDSPLYDHVQASDIFDFEMTPGEHFTHEWIRTCYALQWAARTYADGQSYKRQRQIRRWLSMERNMTTIELPPMPTPPPILDI